MMQRHQRPGYHGQSSSPLENAPFSRAQLGLITWMGYDVFSNRRMQFGSYLLVLLYLSLAYLLLLCS
jgi:hypothetical protein